MSRGMHHVSLLAIRVVRDSSNDSTVEGGDVSELAATPFATCIVIAISGGGGGEGGKDDGAWLDWIGLGDKALKKSRVVRLVSGSEDGEVRSHKCFWQSAQTCWLAALLFFCLSLTNDDERKLGHAS